MRVAFLHPDLGLGGAERLIVDAAAGLARQGHDVTVYTSHYDPARSFAETRDGSFTVHVYGDWLPRHVLGGGHILFAILRSLWLALAVILLHGPFHVIIVDQVSACLPLLRLLTSARLLFYCHFPDQLLSSRTSLLKSLYRAPFDALEQASTSVAHRIVVNSGFTRTVFHATFTRITARPDVLYPCIHVDSHAEEPPPPPREARTLFVSINRYERKKGIHIAILALAQMKRDMPAKAFDRLHLVVVGGYDTRVAENVEHYEELLQLARSNGLVPSTDLGSDVTALLPAFPHSDTSIITTGGSVTFIRSCSDAQKAYLLRATSAVLYTPSNEHFGIVPLEAMAAYRPVIAVASGGPLESIVHESTGFLCEATPAGFAAAMTKIVNAPGQVAVMGRAGHAHVLARFSRQAFTQQLEAMCLDMLGRAPASAAASAAVVSSVVTDADAAPSSSSKRQRSNR